MAGTPKRRLGGVTRGQFCRATLDRSGSVNHRPTATGAGRPVAHIFEAGCFVTGFLAVFFFFVVAAYALSKLPIVGSMTAAPNAAIIAATNSFFMGSLHFVDIAKDRPSGIQVAIGKTTEGCRN